MSDDTAARPLSLHTADGLTLEAEARVPETVRAGVLLTHPHPLHGGTMRSLVTSELFRLLPSRDLAVVRFNFRGVEGSEGTHGGGRAERADVVAGLDGLAGLAPGVPIVVAGWSFGADVALSVTDERLAGWFAVAPPLRILPPGELLAAGDPRPKCLAVPEHDQFRSPASAAEVTAGWVATTLEVITGADHFCVGRTERVAELCTSFVSRLTDSA